MKRGLALLLLLTACHRALPGGSAAAGGAPDLESAAIEAGVIPDPGSADITGLYARDTDRICLVPGARAFRIGLSVDYGDGQSCSGTGTATRAGDTIHVELDNTHGCSFDARFEGDRIILPPHLAPACAARCVGRASLEALDVDRLSESAAEASTMRDAAGRLLCGG